MQTWAFAEGFGKSGLAPARNISGGGLARRVTGSGNPLQPGIGKPTVGMDPTKPYKKAAPGSMDVTGAMRRGRMGDQSGVQAGLARKMGINRFGDGTPKFGENNPFVKQQVGKSIRRDDSRNTRGKKLPDWMMPLVPATTADVYNNTGRNSDIAAGGNMAAKLGGGALGGAAALGALAATKGRIKASPLGSKVLNKPTTIAGHTIGPDHKMGYLASGVSSVGAGIGSYTGASTHRGKVRSNQEKYAYRRPRG